MKSSAASAGNVRGSANVHSSLLPDGFGARQVSSPPLAAAGAAAPGAVSAGGAGQRRRRPVRRRPFTSRRPSSTKNVTPPESISGGAAVTARGGGSATVTACTRSTLKREASTRTPDLKQGGCPRRRASIGARAVNTWNAARRPVRFSTAEARRA